MRLFRPGFFACSLFPEAIFRIKITENVLYLTFDDGPDPASTPILLDILEKHSVKALFFCNGRAAEKFSGLIEKIRNGGHMIGNHGYSHFDGWRTETDKYVNDVIRASKITSDKIFRPPFGHISLRHYRTLKKRYKIVFWDLMPYDFDKSFGSERALGILKEKIRPGSIIVLHDKSASCANAILEEFLIFAKNKGYRFDLVENII